MKLTQYAKMRLGMAARLRLLGDTPCARTKRELYALTWRLRHWQVKLWR